MGCQGRRTAEDNTYLGYCFSLSCFYDLSMIREYPFINGSKIGVGDFLKGYEFF